MLEGRYLVGQGQKCRGQADKSLPLVRLVSFLGPTEQGVGGWEASLQGRGDTAKDREGHRVASTFLGAPPLLSASPILPPKPQEEGAGLSSSLLFLRPAQANTRVLRNLWNGSHSGSEFSTNPAAQEWGKGLLKTRPP